MPACLTQPTGSGLRRTASDQQVEIELGELASRKCALPSIRSFGATMTEEHAALRERSGSALPTRWRDAPAGMTLPGQRLRGPPGGPQRECVRTKRFLQVMLRETAGHPVPFMAEAPKERQPRRSGPHPSANLDSTVRNLDEAKRLRSGGQHPEPVD